MNSRCSVSSQTVENSSSQDHPTSIKEKRGLKRKTWGGEAFVQGTAANWNSATAKTITSASWKLGDNLFMLCCCSNLILFPHLEGLISKTWSAGLLCSRTNHCWSFPHLHLVLECDPLSIWQTETPVIGPGVSRRGTRERVRIRRLHMRAFDVHITDQAADSLLLAASAQMFGCRSFSGSSSGICRGKQTEHFESEAQQQRSDTGATLSRCEIPTFICTGNSLLCQERAIVPLTITC